MKKGARGCHKNKGSSGVVDETCRGRNRDSVIRLSDYISAVISWLKSPPIPFEKSTLEETLQHNI